MRKIVGALPAGERYYPKDQYTDQPLRFMVAELIRESILIETGEEVPYASAVVIEYFEEPESDSLRQRVASCRSHVSALSFTANGTARRRSLSESAAPN